MAEVTLRALQAEEMALITGGDSEFDDWGPPGLRSVGSPCLDENGALAVLAAGELAGECQLALDQMGTDAEFALSGHRDLADSRAPGRGVGQNAQRELVRLFFTHTAVNRVQASTDVENVAEQRALERAGLTREGCVRGSQWRDGGYHDIYVFGIIRTDLS